MSDPRSPRLSLLELHGAVVLFGLAGLFGKFLSLSPLMIVLGRTAFASAALLAWLAFTGRGIGAAWRRLLLARHWLLFTGIVLAFHWVSFFKAIQVSTVAVGLLTISSFPLFVTLLEPATTGQRLRAVDLATALLVLTGLACIVPRFDFGDRITAGVCWGTSSGLAFAVLSLVNRRLVREHSPVVLATGQNLVACLVLLALLPTYAQRVTWHDGLLLAVLGVFCTALAHTLFIHGMAHVRAQLASIIGALEAIYGIAFAFVFLGEIPARRTLLGGGLILLAVFLGTLLRQRHAGEGERRPPTVAVDVPI